MSTTPDALVIVNTSPLFYLHQVGSLDLLRQLYGTIVVPPAVQTELEVGKRQGIDVPDVNTLEWIHLRPVDSMALVPAIIDLGRGEAEVIALGLETAESLLILDDYLARRIADLHGLKYTGTLGVLVKAKQAGYLPSVTSVLTTLHAKGMRLSEKIINEVLRLSGE